MLGISIIIPTFKRVHLCQRLLVSLQNSCQQLEGSVEIILVDNSPQPEAQQIEKICAKYGAKYYFKKISVAAKRNFGVQIATYPIILFIDSDCEATPDLIKEHLSYYQKNQETVAVLGRTQFKGAKTFIWQVVQFTPFLVPFTLANQPSQQIWGPSNNLSCRKYVFEKIGGFDENFPQTPGGEDVDLGFRFYKQGYIFTTNPKALVYHTTETWNNFSQVIARLFNWGKGEFYLYYNHDEFLYYDCPKGLGLGLLMVLISWIILVLERNLQWLLLPVFFLAINFLTRLILHLCYHPDRARDFSLVLGGEILRIIYELGLTWECVKNLWFLPLYHRLIIQPELFSLIWNQQILFTWIVFAQIVCTLGLIQFIL